MKKLARLFLFVLFLSAVGSAVPQFDGGEIPPLCPPGKQCK